MVFQVYEGPIGGIIHHIYKILIGQEMGLIIADIIYKYNIIFGEMFYGLSGAEKGLIIIENIYKYKTIVGESIAAPDGTLDEQQLVNQLVHLVVL